MMIQRVQRGHVNRRIQISDQEIENYFQSEEGKKLTAAEYRVFHALVPLASNAASRASSRACSPIEVV